MATDYWVKCPVSWINDGELQLLGWRNEGANNIAALMCLTVILHKADRETRLARVTYDDFQKCTGLSRALVSRGLQTLKDKLSVISGTDKKGVYQVNGLEGEKPRFGKFPSRNLYGGGDVIRMFNSFKLRSKVELSALKLLFLIVAYRDDTANLTLIGYDKIELHAGMARADISSGLSMLIANQIINTEPRGRTSGDYGVSHAYRIRGINSRLHAGTRPDEAYPDAS